MSNKKSFVNPIKLVFFAILLGAVTGAVIWAFLRAVGIGTNLLWEKLPMVMGKVKKDGHYDYSNMLVRTALRNRDHLCAYGFVFR